MKKPLILEMHLDSSSKANKSWEVTPLVDTAAWSEPTSGICRGKLLFGFGKPGLEQRGAHPPPQWGCCGAILKIWACLCEIFVTAVVHMWKYGALKSLQQGLIWGG